MNTKIIKYSEIDFNKLKESFKRKPVVIPTETVYGLASNIYNEETLKDVYKIKNRPADNPLIVHISRIEMLGSLIVEDIPEYKPLIEKYWPGPLTLIFKANPNSSNYVTSLVNGIRYVAVRMPVNEMARRIIDEMGYPLAAPSANISGRVSITTAVHAYEDLAGRVEVIIDGGPTKYGIESTVFSYINNIATVLRPGSITNEMIEKYFKLNENINNLKSPGLKYKHYAPSKDLKLFDEKNSLIDFAKNYKKIGVLSSDPVEILHYHYYEYINMETFRDSIDELKNHDNFIIQLKPKNLSEFSNIFYEFLREIDKYVDVIVGLKIEKTNEGRAVMDRLERAENK